MLVEDQPFPHTLPDNSTPYYNTNGNTTGAGYDGPGECLKHVFGHGTRLYPFGASNYFPGIAKVVASWMRINASEFVEARNTGGGMKDSAWLFVPPQCDTKAAIAKAAGGGQGAKCKLIILPGGCNAFTDSPPTGGSDGDFARYGWANNIVVLKPCQGGPIDAATFPLNHENLRGMVDVYGQTTSEYATQKGLQVRV